MRFMHSQIARFKHFAVYPLETSSVMLALRDNNGSRGPRFEFCESGAKTFVRLAVRLPRSHATLGTGPPDSPEWGPLPFPGDPGFDPYIVVPAPRDPMGTQAIHWAVKHEQDAKEEPRLAPEDLASSRALAGSCRSDTSCLPPAKCSKR